MPELVAIVAIITFAISGVISQVNDHELAVEAVKAGLQQCVDGNKTVWQKECK